MGVQYSLEVMRIDNKLISWISSKLRNQDQATFHKLSNIALVI